jgi:hypothetical protein
MEQNANVKKTRVMLVNSRMNVRIIDPLVLKRRNDYECIRKI